MKLNPLKCAFGVKSGKFLGFTVNQRGIDANPEKIKALLEMSSPKKPKEVMSLAGRVSVLSRFMSWAMNRCAPFFDVSGLRNASKHSKDAVSAALIREEKKV